MRTSGLMAGVFAVLIASGAAFAGGYLLGKEEGASAPAPVMEVAHEDNSKPETPEQPRVARERNEKPETPAAQPEKEEVAPKPADKVKTAAPTHDAGLTNPEADATAPNKPTNAGTPAEADKPIREQIEDLRKRLEDGVALERLDPESMLGGPKVDFAATITGTVTDASGVPIAGAEIRGNFSEQFNSSSGGSTIGFALARSAEGERLGTTDGGGQFRVEINRKVGEKATLRVSLTANADGYAESTARNVTLKNGETEEGVKLALRQAGTVSGRVVDQSGRGVPGVEVSLGSASSPGGMGGIEYRIGGESQLSATTDAGGEYRIDRVPEGRYRLQLSAKGYREVSGPSIVEAKPGTEARAPADFVVEVTSTIRVALLGGPGVPLRKAFVQLQFKDATGKQIKSLSSRTDDSGVAVINDPPVGTFDVVVKSWGYTSQTIPVTITEKLPCDLGTITLESSKSSDPLDLGD